MNDVHLAAIATAARMEATLETREREVRSRLKDAEREQEIARWQAVEGLVDERTVEVAQRWAAGDRERQTATNRLRAELAGVQAQREVVRAALVLAARRWTLSNQQRSH